MVCLCCDDCRLVSLCVEVERLGCMVAGVILLGHTDETCSIRSQFPLVAACQ